MEYNNLPLGKVVSYVSNYDPSLLCPIARSNGRSKIGLNNSSNLPFMGYDVWNCYEVSWLNLTGKPEVRLLRFYVPSDSPNIVESKSVKLYLNSFNNSKFSEDEVTKLLQEDLSKNTGSNVRVKIFKLSELSQLKIATPPGICLDIIESNYESFELNPDVIKLSQKPELVEETIYSDLLRSNCLVTGQPDWGTVVISYIGAKIDHKSLLDYIISFRNHIEFHEQCIERIFMDIKTRCNPQKLLIQGKYTRRGGIDINPIRANYHLPLEEIDITRLARQ